MVTGEVTTLSEEAELTELRVEVGEVTPLSDELGLPELVAKDAELLARTDDVRDPPPDDVGREALEDTEEELVDGSGDTVSVIASVVVDENSDEPEEVPIVRVDDGRLSDDEAPRLELRPPLFVLRVTVVSVMEDDVLELVLVIVLLSSIVAIELEAAWLVVGVATVIYVEFTGIVKEEGALLEGVRLPPPPEVSEAIELLRLADGVEDTPSELLLLSDVRLPPGLEVWEALELVCITEAVDAGPLELIADSMMQEHAELTACASPAQFSR